MRLSIDCKATVKIGITPEAENRGILKRPTRYGCTEKYVPFGILEEDSGQLHLTFGSSFKTSDFLVDSLKDWWTAIPAEKQAEITHIQLR